LPDRNDGKPFSIAAALPRILSAQFHIFEVMTGRRRGQEMRADFCKTKCDDISIPATRPTTRRAAASRHAADPLEMGGGPAIT
jgi:hypothetical protein